MRDRRGDSTQRGTGIGAWGMWQRSSQSARSLLLAVSLTGLTTFMFLPLLSVRLADSGLSTGLVGIIVGLLLLSSQALSLVIGFVIDRFEPRTVLSSGFALRIVGYATLASGLSGDPSVPLLVVAVVCIGVGGSILGLSTKTQLIREDLQHRREMLALRSTFVNAGVVVGPALGALVYPLGFTYILAACIGSHLMLGLLVVVRVTQTERPVDDATALVGGDPPRRSRPLVIRQWAPLLVVAVAFWAIYSQFYVVLPITAKQMTGSTSAISAVFIINGLMCVLLQYVLLGRVFAGSTTRRLLILGFLGFAVAYVVLAALAGWLALILFVVPFTLAELLIAPGLDQQATLVSNQSRVGLALGAMGVASSVGSFLGASGGGYLLNILPDQQAGTVIGALALLAAGACCLLPKEEQVALTPAPVQ